jgi:hypothetical protein
LPRLLALKDYVFGDKTKGEHMHYMKKIVALLILITGLSVAQILLKAVDCQECCRQGRAASKECFRECNNCTLFNDEAAAEAKDFPQ